MEEERKYQPYSLPKKDGLLGSEQDESPTPRIEIDTDALRFFFEDCQVNLLWGELFRFSRAHSFQHMIFVGNVMMNLERAYDECVKRAHEECLHNKTKEEHA